MLKRLIKKLLHSASHSHHHRRHYSSSAAKRYGKKYYSSSHGFVRPFIGSSSDYKHRHGHMGHSYYKSRRRSSS